MKLSSEKTGNSQRKGFILFPLAFFLVGYLLIFAILYPIAAPYIQTLSLVFDTKTPNFETDGENHLDLSSKPQEDDGTVALSEIAYPKEGDLWDRKVGSFITAVREGGKAPVPTSQILYNQAIIDGIIRSNACGHEVTIDL